MSKFASAFRNTNDNNDNSLQISIIWSSPSLCVCWNILIYLYYKHTHIYIRITLRYFHCVYAIDIYRVIKSWLNTAVLLFLFYFISLHSMNFPSNKYQFVNERPLFNMMNKWKMSHACVYWSTRKRTSEITDGWWCVVFSGNYEQSH